MCRSRSSAACLVQQGRVCSLPSLIPATGGHACSSGSGASPSPTEDYLILIEEDCRPTKSNVRPGKLRRQAARLSLRMGSLQSPPFTDAPRRCTMEYWYPCPTFCFFLPFSSHTVFPSTIYLAPEMTSQERFETVLQTCFSSRKKRTLCQGKGASLLALTLCQCPTTVATLINHQRPTQRRLFFFSCQH